MKSLLIPFTRELQSIYIHNLELENCIDSKGEQSSFLGSLSEQMAKTKQNILKLEAIHQNKRKISCDYLQKLQKLDNKLSQSMDHSSQIRESQLQAIQVKLKKKNQRRKIHHKPEEVKQVKETVVHVEKEIPHKKEVTINEIPEIKLAQPKKINEEEFFKKLNMSMDAAIQRRSQRLQNIQVRLHAQDEIINQHVEKSMKFKEEQEQNRLTQLYSKLMQATQKKPKLKPKHKQNHSQDESVPKQKIKKYTAEEFFEHNQSRTARSITQDQKFIKVKERLEKQREEREQIALSILDRHQQYSYRIRQSKQLMDELSNTCQYYNFKIKEQFII